MHPPRVPPTRPALAAHPHAPVIEPPPARGPTTDPHATSHPAHPRLNSVILQNDLVPTHAPHSVILQMAGQWKMANRVWRMADKNKKMTKHSSKMIEFIVAKWMTKS
jgi:hypothetical protein